MAADVKKIVQEGELLHSDNSNWRSYFQELANFCLPRKAWITSPRITGDRVKFNYLYDSTAIQALQIMAAGFHSNLTNPATKWFGLCSRNRTLMNDHDVQMYFHDCEEIMFTTLNQTNFDTTMQEGYTDGGCFGTMAILSDQDPKYRLKYTAVPIEQLDICEDSNGRVDAVYRTFPLTAIQAFRKWGNNVGKSVLDVYEDKPFEKFDFLHYVGPRYEREGGKEDSLNLPFMSCWIAVKDKHLIEESGFEEMPYHVGRFWKSTDPFGFSPAMNALCDIKTLNAQQRTALRRGMKEADPPLQLPSRGYLLPLNLNPSALNYRNKDVNADELQPIGVGAGNFSITLEMMEMKVKQIENAFFVPLFRALSDVTKQMSIPEVQRRVMENMVLLGPVVGRWTHEVLDPIIIRLYNTLARNFMLPEPPEILDGQEFDVYYLSPLAKAQRESELASIESFIGTVGGIANFAPEVLDKLSPDRTVEVIQKIKGVTPEIMRTDKEVEGIRENRAQMQAQAAKLDVAHKLAATADSAGSAAKGFAGAKKEE